MVRIYELRQKEIINIKDGCRFGYVADVVVDEECGKIVEIVIPGPAKIFGVFGREQEYRVPWESIKQIGEDIILVDMETDKALMDCAY